MTVATQDKNSGPINGVTANFGVNDIETEGDLRIGGTTTMVGALTVGGVAVPLANVTAIPLNQGRAPAAWKDALGDTATGAVLGLADTPGSVLLAEDPATATVTQSALFLFTLPPTYVAGAAVTVRLRAKQATALSGTSSKVDVVAKLVGDTLGSDICTTASQQVTTAYANYDFVVTPTGLVGGDILALDCFCIDIDTSVGGAMSISRVEVRLAAA